MPERSNKRRWPLDLNELAASIVQGATDKQPKEEEPQKDLAAVSLGRRGGLKVGPVRAAKLTAEQRSEIGKKAAAKRGANCIAIRSIDHGAHASYAVRTMALVDVNEAKTQFSELLERVAQGEEIVITRAGRPVARLVPVAAPSEPRVPGGWEGRAWIAPDFDELPSEVADAFEDG